ncbi:hypothetical protein LWF15_35235 [Kineosporia rhizophila]|uniref:hypothetical protein n=1 Tax=Kineosporia rhizophila TaxID=84633 RepID=UPI001E6565B2|nr:hypothetical protein [Kineosporia rhizophila]MCE0540759.1 hypothetical protein [Kineosporia rhizophila]
MLIPVNAQARSTAEAISVPLHSRPADVTLIGASASGAAVLQEGAGAADPDLVRTGAWGESLAARAEVDTRPAFRQMFEPGPVVGGELTWSRYSYGSNSGSSRLFRTDLLTGDTMGDGLVSGRNYALTGPTWVSMPDPFATYPFGSSRLITSPVATAPGPDGGWTWPGSAEFWKPEASLGPMDWDVQGTDVVIAVSPVDPEQEQRLQILSVPLGTGLPETVPLAVPVTVRYFDDLEVSANAVAWSGDGKVWVMPRSGGTPTVHAERNDAAYLDSLVVTDSGTVGYLVPAGDVRVTLRTIDRDGVTDIELPAGSAGLAAVGDDFVTATGRGPEPGVYRIGPDGVPSLAATFDAPKYTIGGWDLNAGTLYYSDQSAGSRSRGAVWARAVDDSGLGARRRLPAAVGIFFEAVDTLPASFSAARGLVGSPEHGMQWDVLERGRRTTSIEQAPVKGKYGRQFQTLSEVKISGPYTLIGGQVNRADGELLHLLPRAARLSGHSDIFGSNVVYASTAGRKSQVWSVDVEKPRPVRLFEQSCSRALPVAVWAGTAAWLSCDASEAFVQDLSSQARRTVPTGITSAEKVDLAVGEGTLAWVADGQAGVLDLSAPESTPIPLPGRTLSLALDGPRLARLLDNGKAAAPDLTVERLPYPVPSRPRLIGTVRTLGFSPDGDKVRDTWSPEFDTTEPVRRAGLKLISQRTGRTVRVLSTAETADGSIRDLVWDGTTAAGRKVPQGYYAWTLSAWSASGVALTSNGPPISGQVELTR